MTTSRRRMMRWALLPLVAALALALLSNPAGAHNSEQSYVYLEIFDTAVEGKVQYPVSDVNEILGLSIPNDGPEAFAAVEASLPELQAYADDHLGMADVDGGEWEIVWEDYNVLELSAGSYVTLFFEVDRDFVSVPRQFVVGYDGVMREKPEKDALLLIQTDFGSGTFNNEGEDLLRYTAGNSVQTVDLGETSFWKGITAVIDLGVEHIRIGTDHILFIFALVMPAVLVFSAARGWQPSANFGSSLWRVLKVVSVFTLAHSVTLALGGFGVIELSPALVETVIAISIALAALHNIRPVFANKEWLIAGIFGLFHGFGFAGLLSELGLTQSRQFASLLGFNIGIEIGQSLIILAVFPALYIARRTRIYLPAMYVGSVILIAIALGWALDRAFGIDLKVDLLVNRVVLWPRVLVFLALLYVVAGSLYLWEQRRGTLLPVTGESSEEEPVAAG